jgi:hypothetical protein
MEPLNQINWDAVIELLKAVSSIAVIFVFGYLFRNLVKRYPRE